MKTYRADSNDHDAVARALLEKYKDQQDESTVNIPVSTVNTPVKCCRCRNQHMTADRHEKPVRKSGVGAWSMSESVCPRCGGKAFYDMRPQVAWCWASGLIEFGDALPCADAIEFARGPQFALKALVGVYARRGKGASTCKLLVPGVPEATDQLAGLQALTTWLNWINTRKPRDCDGVTFTKEVQ